MFCLPEIRGDKLVLTMTPPNAKLQLTVTDVAGQFGPWDNPKIKRAEIVRRSFRISALVGNAYTRVSFPEGTIIQWIFNDSLENRVSFTLLTPS